MEAEKSTFMLLRKELPIRNCDPSQADTWARRQEQLYDVDNTLRARISYLGLMTQSRNKPLSQIRMDFIDQRLHNFGLRGLESHRELSAKQSIPCEQSLDDTLYHSEVQGSPSPRIPCEQPLDARSSLYSESTPCEQPLDSRPPIRFTSFGRSLDGQPALNARSRCTGNTVPVQSQHLLPHNVGEIEKTLQKLTASFIEEQLEKMGLSKETTGECPHVSRERPKACAPPSIVKAVQQNQDRQIPMESRLNRRGLQSYERSSNNFRNTQKVSQFSKTAPRNDTRNGSNGVFLQNLQRNVSVAPKVHFGEPDRLSTYSTTSERCKDSCSGKEETDLAILERNLQNLQGQIKRMKAKLNRAKTRPTRKSSR